MDPDRAWVLSRLVGAPPRLRGAVLRAWDDAAGETVAARCAAAAVRLLRRAETLATRRPEAFDLLAADALLTMACEHVAEVASDDLAEFARSIGPGGGLSGDERPARSPAHRSA
ncbi:MAG: hypothetical protein HY702_08490 [Gemmatimonadetes bacterium]|nr:hypothetical protein [Gemmatimonadota bacterium]